ncbi:MAG: DEAD/DEAH box helicase, partial [Deltaproteobacteria bacterium]|nr:DEAD/DEAH box helicase [Deltaproteobacteria bacterium]
EDILAHDMGLFVAPPGVGKTVVGTYLVAARGRTTLILVHRKPLLEQWVAQLSIFLGIPEGDIGVIGGGRDKGNGRLDVAMLQSLNRKGSVKDLVAAYGHVILDECHHLPAVSFEQVLSECKARYVVGLTATPYRRDGHQPIIHMHCGPVRHVIDARSQLAKRPFDHELVCRHTKFRLPGEEDISIQSIYAAMASDAARNRMILDDIVVSLKEGRSPIVLTERKDHLQLLAGELSKVARHLVVLHGGMKPKERREALQHLAEIPEDEERLLLATGRYIGEGFDDARLDTLFLAMPVSWKGTLVQYTGRLHRLHPEKSEVRIYDYVDGEVPMLARMFERRLRGYRAIGYEPQGESTGLPSQGDQAEVENEGDGDPDDVD